MYGDCYRANHQTSFLFQQPCRSTKAAKGSWHEIRTDMLQDRGVLQTHSMHSLQARLSLGRRESGQIPIRFLYCILSSRAPNKVSVNINWDVFCKGRSSVFLNGMPKKATARLHWSLTQLTRQEILGVWKLTRLSPRMRVWRARLFHAGWNQP